MSQTPNLNSLEAKDLPHKLSQHKKILEALRKQSATRNELSERLKLPINVICPRVNELIKMDLIYEKGNQTVYHVSGKSKRAILFIK